MKDIDLKCIDEIRLLSAEMITKAKSGHPGICLGAAPILHTLFTRFLNVNPIEPNFLYRDRFVLSAGHGSALLYVLLHLSGYKISIEDLKQFRQKNSITPGHPEYLHTPGVDITTGPLGQGISSAVGFAMASKYKKGLVGKVNPKYEALFDYYTYVLCGDGDLQEGVTNEALALAGRQKLNNLIVLYDSNDIQLDSRVEKTTKINTKMYFKSLGFKYILVKDANNLSSLIKAISKAKQSLSPVIIEIKSKIGYKSSLEDTTKVHGKALSVEEIEILKRNLDLYNDFSISEEVYDFYKKNVIERAKNLNSYLKNLEEEILEYTSKNDEFKDIYRLLKNTINLDINQEYKIGNSVSTRVACGKYLEKLQEINKVYFGGSADLSSSTMIKGIYGDFDIDNRCANNIMFGVREHAMAAICNGITLSNLHGFASSFFVFSDYLKPAIRQAALMNLNSLFIFSHDSICVGEDGPTHQPVEQLPSLRLIPNCNVIRPCDATEVYHSLIFASNDNNFPTCILTSRQNLDVVSSVSYENFIKGAYVIYEAKNYDRIVIATGSEVSLCINAAKELEKENVFVKVVSMPSMFMFELQPESYKKEILNENMNVLAVEMAASGLWYKYANKVLSVDSFGKSMPLSEIVKEFNFTVENVKKLIKEL